MPARIKGKNKYSTSQLFNFAQNSYLERTSRPIYAVVFLLPFIVFYEVGTILINTDVLNQSQIRVVAFVWLQRFLEYLGSGSKLAWAAPPLVVVIILIALQLASHKRWGFALGDVWPMAVECSLLAIPLIVLGLFLNSPAEPQGQARRFTGSTTQITMVALPTLTNEGPSPPAENDNYKEPAIRLLANVVTSIGAGIYEELVFRLILICLLMLLFQDILRLSHRNSIILAVLVSAALFSAYHHLDFFSGQLYQRDQFSWTKFTFRTIAGVYFAVLFAIRGFGITAGTHAFYDIIANLINVLFFETAN